MSRPATTLLLLAALACKPDDPGRHDPGTWPDDTGETGLVVEGCRAQPQAADRARLVVVSYPYTAAGGQADSWQALSLGTDGGLQAVGERFEMGRATAGRVAFTPDGSLGLCAQDDGSIGVFEALSAEEVRVVHEAFSGDFYAVAVVSDPAGEWAWIVDGNWPENGGGLYRAAIDCDSGGLSAPQRVLEAKLPAALLWLESDPERALMVGREAGGALDGEDAFLLAPGESTQVLSGVDVFGDDEAIFAGAALGFDDAYALVGDSSFFSGLPNRVGVISLGDELGAVQVLEDIDDPVAIVASVHDDLALVVSGYSDALFVLDHEPGADEPFSLRGEPGYQGASPQLPAAADQLERGPLGGLVLITENQGVRRVQLSPGVVEDLGRVDLGSGLDAIPGAIGIQP